MEIQIKEAEHITATGIEEHTKMTTFRASVQNRYPKNPAQLSINEIIFCLSKPIDPKYISSKKAGSTEIKYISWYNTVVILDRYAPGWSFAIRSTQLSEDRIFITGCLTIHASDGTFTREATGTETLKELRKTKTGSYEMQELAYGDPSSNAESMAFRRCAAKFGLGLYLYDK